MTFKKHILTYCLLIIASVAFSQQTEFYNTKLKDFNHAIELYDNNAYMASQQLLITLKSEFKEETELRANCEYYIANCAIRLDQPNADDLMLDFVKKYPTSTKQNSAFLETADFYFNTGKYPYALKWYQKVDTSNLTTFQKDEYNFKFGYSLFATKNYNKSKEYFSQLLDSPKYGSQAKYYYGYIAYSNNEYETADQYLGQVVTDDSYKSEVSYYLAEMNFKLGKFEKAIKLGEPLLAKTKKNEHSQLSKIIGECYFNLKKYEKAVLHLKNYKGTRGKWNNTDYYMLGYAYFKQGDFENAIAHFNKIISGDNAVAQNAYYHLGHCYLNQQKKSEALNAFRNASQMDYDLLLQEDADYNYAKLSYEVGNPYKSSPEVLKDFIKKHPKTTHKPEIESLIISAYLTSQDYDGALDYLKSKKDKASQEQYQKAAFNQGILKFNESKFHEAFAYFDKSLEQPIDQTMYARSLFWSGESSFQLNNFDEALRSFKSFINNSNSKKTSERSNIFYHLAYTFFNRKEYDLATKYFQKYLDKDTKDQLKRNDSYSRIADIYFISSKYEDAINTYNKIVSLNATDADYAQFQKAVSYGFIRQDAKKIQELNTFIQNYPESSFQDDAYFVLANEYVDAKENSKALEKYDYLINNFEHSPLISKTMLKKGAIYYNTERNDEALRTYKRVVKQFPNTPEAKQAVSSARQIYLDLGRVDEYAKWVKNIDFISVSNADLDNDTYESAEQQYLQGNHKRAITGFSKYINLFPTGLHSLHANYYLAEALFSMNRISETIPHYLFVTEQGQNEFTEQSLYRLSLAYLQNDNWKDAIPVLSRLELISNDPQNILFSQSNLMKGYYVDENYSKAVSYAETVLSNPKIDNKVKSDAQIIIARSAIKTKNESKARVAYGKVEEIAVGELKAESLYYNAYFLNKDDSYDSSNELLQQIASEFSAHKYWAAKSLVLMAKNHYELKDAFQATYILESVIKNFIQYKDIVDEASIELNIIKTKESKTNDSIQGN